MTLRVPLSAVAIDEFRRAEEKFRLHHRAGAASSSDNKKLNQPLSSAGHFARGEA
ncbi:hypothetical protein MTX20_21145 [Bradyrhizobium sp. ISRA435]|nr:hypothetical protein MTX20_21145 [Bradyrhizobium sp. ISRA435]